MPWRKAKWLHGYRWVDDGTVDSTAHLMPETLGSPALCGRVVDPVRVTGADQRPACARCVTAMLDRRDMPSNLGDATLARRIHDA